MRSTLGAYLWGSTIPTDELTAWKIILGAIFAWYASSVFYEHHESVQWNLTMQKLILRTIFAWCVIVGIVDPHASAGCTEIKFGSSIDFVRYWAALRTPNDCSAQFNHVKMDFDTSTLLLRVYGDHWSPRRSSLHRNFLRATFTWYASVVLYEHSTGVQWNLTTQKLILRLVFNFCMSVGIDDPHGCANGIKKLFCAQYLFGAPLWGSTIPTDALTS